MTSGVWDPLFECCFSPGDLPCKMLGDAALGEVTLTVLFSFSSVITLVSEFAWRGLF